jgi:tetratricopeptide (TPR) repeat protein
LKARSAKGANTRRHTVKELAGPLGGAFYFVAALRGFLRNRAGLAVLVVALNARFLVAAQIDSGSNTENSPAFQAQRDDWQRQLRRSADLVSDGNFAEAERTLIASVHKAEQPGSDPLWLPAALDRLAGFARHLGRNRQAEQFYLRAVDLWQTRFGSLSLGLAMTLSDLAWVYVALGDPSRAESLWRRSIEIRTAVLGPFDPAVARVYGYLAVGSFAAHRLNDSESFCEQALRIYERTGKLPGDTDQVLNSLASVRLRQGRASEAVQFAREAIDLDEAATHPSPKLLSGYFYNLALAEAATEQTAEADADFLHALSLSPDAPYTNQMLRSNILQSYAAFLAATGRKKEAKTVRKQEASLVKAMRQETYADDIVDVLSFH